MKKHYTLVRSTVSSETIQALAQMSDGATSGDLLGFACVAMRKHHQYVIVVTGECSKSPTFTRGMVAALDDELCDLIHRNGE